MSRRWVIVLVPLLVGAITRAAWAEPGGDDAAAEALFDEAVVLRNAGDRAGACAKFRRSYKLSPARGTLLNIAECYEAEGKLASAWATYSALADKAEASDDRERLRIARDKRVELAPRLAHLTIVVASAPAALDVRRDDASLPVDVLGEPVPIDAGTHTIAVSAPGFHAWTTTVDITDGADRRVDVPALEPLPPPPPTAPIAPVADAHVRPIRHRHPRRTVGMITTGAGALGVTAGLGFGFMAMRREREAGRNCNGDLVCNRAGVDQLDSAHSFARGADILVGAGFVVAAVGATLWWTSPVDRVEERTLTLSPIAAPGTIGLALGGRL